MFKNYSFSNITSKGKVQAYLTFVAYFIGTIVYPPLANLTYYAASIYIGYAHSKDETGDAIPTWMIIISAFTLLTNYFLYTKQHSQYVSSISTVLLSTVILIVISFGLAFLSFKFFSRGKNKRTAMTSGKTKVKTKAKK